VIDNITAYLIFVREVLPTRFELVLLDSKSNVLTMEAKNILYRA